jgi:integrase
MAETEWRFISAAGVWWFHFRFRGQRIQESTKQRNKRVADQMEAARKTQLAKGEVGLQDRKPVPTLKDFAPRFAAAIETACAEKPATVSFYKAKLAVLVRHLGSRRLDRIEEGEIEQYTQMRARQKSRRKRALSPASVNRDLATFRRLLRLAHEWKVLNRVPRVHLLRGENQREFTLSLQQENLKAAEGYGDLPDVAAFLIDTGLRAGECLTLEWPDVLMEPAEGAQHGYLTVRRKKAKNSKARNVPLTARALEILRRRNPAARGLVFHRANGQPLYQTWLNQQHSALRDLLKLPADFVSHSFRHTYGTRLGETGADGFTIMRLMGHSSVTVSQRYVHPSPETVEHAVSRMEAYNRAGMQVPATISATIGSTDAVVAGQVL